MYMCMYMYMYMCMYMYMYMLYIWIMVLWCATAHIKYVTCQWTRMRNRT